MRAAMAAWSVTGTLNSGTSSAHRYAPPLTNEHALLDGSRTISSVKSGLPAARALIAEETVSTEGSLPSSSVISDVDDDVPSGASDISLRARYPGKQSLVFGSVGEHGQGTALRDDGTGSASIDSLTWSTQCTSSMMKTPGSRGRAVPADQRRYLAAAGIGIDVR